ncbi:hypothetical protein EXIGLDRAFT_845684 [Exidia glandulosa HHB12029]|uniref:F-box domain-containing protein n=1 Tax=Exidia glandulosa HHB12029 TaxID=1314781 RepID=A0A165BBR5_EXIGL|nr:hypothetical protein EXIGLDRAFT_845684 [Exidia glandulosa HHB12029]
MASAEGSTIACSRNNLPEHILDYIFDIAGSSIADARAFSLVCRAWLIPARTVLFREVTVLAERGPRNALSTGMATKAYPDAREVTLYPRCMAAKTFIRLASAASYLLSFVQVLKTSNNDLVQFLSSIMPNGSLQRIRELWLSDMTASADVDFHHVFAHFPALRALRVQNFAGVQISSQNDVLGVERTGPVFVRLLGSVSLALHDSLATSKHSRIVELSALRVDHVRQHADTLTRIDFFMPFFSMRNKHVFTSIVPALDECRVLDTLHIDSVRSVQASQIMELLTVARLDSMRSLCVELNGCLINDAGLINMCSGMDEVLAPRAQLQTVAFLIPCGHSNCPRQIKRNMPNLRLRTDVELRVSILTA